MVDWRGGDVVKEGKGGGGGREGGRGGERERKEMGEGAANTRQQYRHLCVLHVCVPYQESLA